MLYWASALAARTSSVSLRMMKMTLAADVAAEEVVVDAREKVVETRSLISRIRRVLTSAFTSLTSIK